eukprot:TRINITY_DN113868_c0_g1_i1.p2 TRINITY_DN113868_c0_g1~~TRINITY_DN113868_c0_g1_i1.p2  ORF type:complete len:196 (+),score=45.13 TRINITY_DN113868_c0_g1_i1:145-732(+)
MGDFVVTLQRSSGSELIGLSLTVEPNFSFAVNEVKEVGMVARWNAQQISEDTMIQKGDTIIAVNGVSVNVAVMQEQMTQPSVVLTVKRGERMPDALSAWGMEPDAAPPSMADLQEVLAAQGAPPPNSEEEFMPPQEGVVVEEAEPATFQGEAVPAMPTMATLVNETSLEPVSYGEVELHKKQAEKEERLCRACMC